MQCATLHHAVSSCACWLFKDAPKRLIPLQAPSLLAYLKLRTVTIPLMDHHNAEWIACRWRTHRSPEYFVNFRRFELPVSLESAKRRCYKALSNYSQTRPHMESLQELCIDVYQRHHARKLAAWCGFSLCNALLAACHLLQLCLMMSSSCIAIGSIDHPLTCFAKTSL